MTTLDRPAGALMAAEIAEQPAMLARLLADGSAEIAAVRAAVEHAERTQRATAARSRALALRLRDFGLSGADIAVVLGVSPQRVSQLMRTTGC
jgi:CRP-like cAMP-binding protein